MEEPDQGILVSVDLERLQSRILRFRQDVDSQVRLSLVEPAKGIGISGKLEVLGD